MITVIAFTITILTADLSQTIDASRDDARRSDAVAQHEANRHQRYKVGHVAGRKRKLSLFIT